MTLASSRGRCRSFARSLPLCDALSRDVLLAAEMNGAPLAREHGAPLRLVVPRAYGVASVKWVSRIEVRVRPFQVTSGPGAIASSTSAAWRASSARCA